MANKSQRAAALMLAGLFFLTTVGTTAYVIWQIKREDPVATGDQIQTPTNNNQREKKVLKGTPLADFTPTKEPISSIQKIDTVEGSGAEAVASSTVTVNYTLANMDDGVVRESSLDSQPLTSPLSGLIKGWQDGVPGMKVGGKRRLLIPSAQAYNDGKDLVFDIELLDIK
jgi:peptidylprolyl isomerase